MIARHSRLLLVLCVGLVAAACKRAAPLPREPADAGASTEAAVPVPVLLPDAGSDALRAAQDAVKANHVEAPLRLDLIADLRAETLLGVAPGAPLEALEKKLGGPGQARGEIVRWPQLGVEAVVQGGHVERLALHASRLERDPEMNIFVGEVLLGAAPLTQVAPDLSVKQLVSALGQAGRIEKSPEVTETAWRRGGAVLYLTFDNQTLQLEAIVLEPFSETIWNGMKPLESSKKLWDLEPSAAPRPNTVAFAQLSGPMPLSDVMNLRLISGHLPHAKLLFDTLQAKFLAHGDSLRQIDGHRAAMLRSDGCTYLVREQDGDVWEARNPGIECDAEREPEGVTRLQRLFATPRGK